MSKIVPSYTELGFDCFLHKGPRSVGDANAIPDISNGFQSSLKFGSTIEGLDFGQSGIVSSGSLISKSGRLIIDLDNDRITVSDGVNVRVLIGKDPGGF